MGMIAKVMRPAAANQARASDLVSFKSISCQAFMPFKRHPTLEGGRHHPNTKRSLGPHACLADSNPPNRRTKFAPALAPHRA
jgi:hypothetical protein